MKLTKQATLVQYAILDSLNPSKNEDLRTARALDPLRIEEVDHEGLSTIKLSREAMFVNDSPQLMVQPADTICSFLVICTFPDRALESLRG